MKKIIPLASLLAVGLACSPKAEESKLDQAFDSNNLPTMSGYSGKIDFDSLSSTMRVSTDRLPWADTYWPLINKGLSARWQNLTANPSSEIGLVDFLDSHLLETEQDVPNANLSPAEKYDLIYRWRHNKKLDNEQFVAFRQNIAASEEKITASEDLAEKRRLVREINRTLQNNPQLRAALPMSWDGWLQWTNYTSSSSYQYLNQSDTGENWSWMGLCHGWAPAAIMAEAPKYSVKIDLDGKEVLMTEGDIRGLLTYSWSHYSPNDKQYFIGRRCNIDVADVESRGPLDENDRNTYGAIQMTSDSSKLDFLLIQEETHEWMQTNWLARTQPYSNLRAYRIRLYDEERSVRYLLEHRYYSRTSNRWLTSYYVGRSISHLRNFAVNQSINGVIQPLSTEINGCGDVNPAALHTTIIQTLKDEKLGFVIDRTQSGQVWNQPVHQAKVNVGDLLAIDSINIQTAGFAKRFAPNTRYISEVTTELAWTYEPSTPSMTYTTEFDQYYSKGKSSLNYILEFDENKQMIGGEWGSLSGPQPADQVPDFIYGFEKGSKPTDKLSDGFDFSGIIDQIHACSLREQADGVEYVNNRKISYVNCELSQVTP